MQIWRISNDADLSGRGGLLAAGRWNEIKTPIVYCTDHPAAALLEILVHVDREDLPSRYQLLGIDVPDGAIIQAPALPDGWKDDIASTRRIGSEFVRANVAPVMSVPSVIVPFSVNYLINPALAEAAGIGITSRTAHPVDRRILG